jgi:hypothetical protein
MAGVSVIGREVGRIVNGVVVVVAAEGWAQLGLRVTIDPDPGGTAGAS